MKSNPIDPETRHRGSQIEAGSRIAVSGAGGLVGSAFVRFMKTRGHSVVPLVRREAGAAEIGWDPMADSLDPAAFAGLDGVVHLAGENIAAGRWSPGRKAVIRASRVRGTRVLCEALAAARPRPPVLVSASAIGFYGDRGDEVLDEDSAAGDGFLPDLCREWEAATEPARRAGIRVVQLRIGVVLSRAGGALPKMARPVSWGVGGRLGHGRQMMSWIGLDDLVAAIHFALGDPRLAGPVNATAPRPVSNLELTRLLGRVLRRPTLLPVPARVLRLLLGEMAEALMLAGSDVRPRRLEQAGFRFGQADLERLLRCELC